MTKLGDIAAADPVVARYMQDVGRTLLRRNLALTPEQRLLQLQELGELTGAGNYDAIIEHTVTAELFGFRCLCLDLPTLIRAKTAAGRPRDLDAVAELRALLAERAEKKDF